jgi:hypothetical protein
MILRTYVEFAAIDESLARREPLGVYCDSGGPKAADEHANARQTS